MEAQWDTIASVVVDCYIQPFTGLGRSSGALGGFLTARPADWSWGKQHGAVPFAEHCPFLSTSCLLLTRWCNFYLSSHTRRKKNGWQGQERRSRAKDKEKQTKHTIKYELVLMSWRPFLGWFSVEKTPRTNRCHEHRKETCLHGNNVEDKRTVNASRGKTRWDVRRRTNTPLVCRNNTKWYLAGMNSKL